MRKRLHSLGEVPIEGRIEAAQVKLSTDDLTQLEAGDIIILDNHELKIDNQAIAGTVTLSLGNGNNGHVRGQLINREDHTRFKVLDIISQEQPQP